jgi:hypothetical protein
MSGKGRKFRTKLSFQEDDEEEAAPAQGKAPAPKPAKPTLLSFGDDEEGPLLSTKKKQEKKKASKFAQPGLKAPDAAAAPQASTQRPGAGAAPPPRGAPAARQGRPHSAWQAVIRLRACIQSLEGGACRPPAGACAQAAPHRAPCCAPGAHAHPPPPGAPAGEYSAERLRELQKNTLRLPADKKPPPAPLSEGLKLSGSFKPAGKPKDDRFSVPAGMAVRAPPPAEEVRAPHTRVQSSRSNGCSGLPGLLRMAWQVWDPVEGSPCPWGAGRGAASGLACPLPQPHQLPLPPPGVLPAG